MPSGHEIRHRDACLCRVSRISPKFLSLDVHPNDPDISPGCPSRQFLSGLFLCVPESAATRQQELSNLRTRTTLKRAAPCRSPDVALELMKSTQSMSKITMSTTSQDLVKTQVHGGGHPGRSSCKITPEQKKLAEASEIMNLSPMCFPAFVAFSKVIG